MAAPLNSVNSVAGLCGARSDIRSRKARFAERKTEKEKLKERERERETAGRARARLCAMDGALTLQKGALTAFCREKDRERET